MKNGCCQDEFFQPHGQIEGGEEGFKQYDVITDVIVVSRRLELLGGLPALPEPSTDGLDPVKVLQDRPGACLYVELCDELLTLLLFFRD